MEKTDNRGSARGAVEQAVDVQRLALQPDGESRSGEQVIEHHGQFEPFPRGKERFQVHHSHLTEGRVLHALDERAQIERLVPPPGIVQDVGEQNMFAGTERVGVHSEESEQTGGGRRHAIAQQVGVGQDGGRRHGKGRQDGDRLPRLTAGRVDVQFDRLPQAGDPLAILVPLRQSVSPKVGLTHGVLLAGSVPHDPRLRDRPRVQNPPAAVRGRSATGCPDRPWGR